MFFSKKFKTFNNINHAFFSKNGGVSQGIYSSLNCGLGSKDKKENVLKNLDIVSKQIELNNKNLFTMNQTHSNRVVVINDTNKHVQRVHSDALVTRQKNIAISVLTADCVPVLIYDEVNQIIGSIHAGWKGAVSGIIENTLSEIFKISKNNKINVAIGPCIGVNNYEVGKEFYAKFIKESKKNERFFLSNGKDKLLFNLRNYINSKFEELDVKYIENIDIDTFSDNINFFSFRRSKHLGEKDYGRCISVISLIND
ncbi:peptidoglycan editing factor PgeF [Pelagibacteraceae bacterium]|nr:peptidoglycan editing factor PgeF [Pelagibacteraceae bacterium]